jgi:maltoporin
VKSVFVLLVAGALTFAWTTSAWAKPETRVEKSAPETGFAFGSYGRVLFGSDFDGTNPQPVKVVKYGARIVEPTYLELDLYYRLRSENGVTLQTVTTLAFGDRLFHDIGEFDARLALRNFYLEAEKGSVSVWAGSRMLRGDSIYLLDYWPLDDANTLGGGVTFRQERFTIGGHVGINRLLDPFQFQDKEVLSPGLGTDRVETLDRLRYIATVQATYLLSSSDRLKLRGKVYGEVQALPSGEREANDGTIEKLQDDWGVSVGAQLTAWDFAPRGSHANLFVRYSRGLTAFDELNAPTGVSAMGTVFPRAAELVFGTSASYEWGPLGLLGGGYLRHFEDADPSERDRDDGWEYIADIRPAVEFAPDLQAAIDLSYQVRFPKGPSLNTLTAMDPAVFQVAPMLVYSPFGEGVLARPQFRLVYRAAHLNPGARDLYPMEDPRATERWQHYVGVQAEWWFNSTQSYPRQGAL